MKEITLKNTTQIKDEKLIHMARISKESWIPENIIII